MRGLTVVVGAAALVVATRAREARACSPAAPGLTYRVLFPPAGSTAVPLNPRLLVRYGTGGNFQLVRDAGVSTLMDGLELRHESGTPVPIQKTTLVSSAYRLQRDQAVVIQPLQPLQPETVYQVWDRLAQIPCGRSDQAACAFGEPQLVASFTTGTASDITPPQFAGVTSLEPGVVVDCRDSGCCGPYLLRILSAKWTAADDAVSGGSVLYNLYAEGSSAPLAALIGGTQLSLAYYCSRALGPGDISSLPIELGRYVVRAVDWAGNEDSNTAVFEVTGSCASAPVGDGAASDSGSADSGSADTSSVEVGGTIDSAARPVDAGVEAPAASATRGSGCGCELPSGASRAYAPVGFLLLAIWRRRR